MTKTKRRSLWALGVVIALVFVGLGTIGYQLYESLPKSISNGYLVTDLATWSTAAKKEETDISEEAVLRILFSKGNSVSHYASRFQQFPTILDFWGEPLKHSRLGDEWEWRSAGRDQVFDTKDDRFARYPMMIGLK